MNSALMFLFILDFSGSMYQKVDNQPKYVILQENVRALNQSFNDEILTTNSGVLTFGLNPKNKCDDFNYEQVPSHKISQTVDKYLPGAFSKTPLGESIRRGTDITIKQKVKKVIIFSDGADSCGKDPCQELVKANQKLKKANYFMNIKFIGINLVKNDPKFECFRNNRLSHINIEFSNISDSFDLQKTLQKESDIALEKVKNPWGLITVRGAPANVIFKANASKSIKNGLRAKWYGAYSNQLKAGKYIITSSYSGTKALSVEIDSEKERELVWSDFFKDDKSKISFTRSTLSLTLVPEFETQQAHRSVSPVLIEGLIEEEALQEIKIPFGEWVVEAVSPPWLKSTTSPRRFNLKPESSQKIDFNELFDLDWIKNPDPLKQWVISIGENSDKNETLSLERRNLDSQQRFFIQKGVDSIPVVRGAKVNWIESSQ